MYNNRSYFARRAGVLGEYLAAGKPVVVPAGCWLAEQLAEVNFAYAERLLKAAQQTRKKTSVELLWHCGFDPKTQSLRIAGDQAFAPAAMISVPPGATELVLSFQWLSPNEQGHYLKLLSVQTGAMGMIVDQFESVHGRRSAGGINRCLIRIEPGVTDLVLQLAKAYDSHPVFISQWDAAFLSDSSFATPRRPLGAVGLAAADLGATTRCIRDICDNFDHYKRTAELFSGEWFAQHDPRRTLNELLLPFRGGASRAA
jgi:hypothetical protein